MFLLLVQVYCLAQVDRAGLNGTIRDTTGKVIPGARVEAIQTATGLRRDTISSSSGTYDIPELPIGLYRIACSASGFKEFVIEDLEQTVGHTRTLDITLGVGGITQQVNVSGRGHATGRNDRHTGRAHRAGTDKGAAAER